MNTHSRKTEGATLFVVMLVVLLLLTAVMAITAQMTLLGRNTSADQEATLRAQYANESTVARARSSLKVLSQALVTANTGTTGVKYGLNVPTGTDPISVASMVAALCGVSALPSPSATATVCQANGKTTNILANLTDAALDTRLQLFSTYVSPQSLKLAGAPVDPSSATSAKQYWRQIFGGAARGQSLGSTINNVQTESTAGMIITKVMYPNLNTYAIYLRIPNISVQATGGRATQAVQLQSQNTDYILVIGPKSFAKYALFTNHHYSNSADEGADNKIWFTDRTKFTGPVHTNQRFNFTGDTPGPTFTGEVTSAGCTQKGISADELSCSGTIERGAFFHSSSERFVPASTLGTNPEPVVCGDARTCTASNTTRVMPHFGSVDFQTDFKRFPNGSQTQEADAKAGGLFLDGPLDRLDLAVVNGQVDINKNAIGKAQSISYTIGSNKTTLLINARGNVFISTPSGYKAAVQLITGAWVDRDTVTTGITSNTFNGVVYVKSSTTGTDGIKALRGPARNNNADNWTPSNTPASIADFMNLNIVSNGSMHIKSDLTYEAQPCSLSDGSCDNMTAKNILGLYSSDGSIVLDSPKKYPGATAGLNNGMPKNVVLNAVMMAKKGSVNVDGHDTAGTANELGNVNIVGGIIENYYGAFGTTAGTGFGRNIIFDKRTGQGLIPKSYPSLPEWDSTLQDSDGDAIKLNLSTSSQSRISQNQYKNNKNGAQ